jgi:hypothetical protein
VINESMFRGWTDLGRRLAPGLESISSGVDGLFGLSQGHLWNRSELCAISGIYNGQAERVSRALCIRRGVV